MGQYLIIIKTGAKIHGKTCTTNIKNQGKLPTMPIFFSELHVLTNKHFELSNIKAFLNFSTYSCMSPFPLQGRHQQILFGANY